MILFFFKILTFVSHCTWRQNVYWVPPSRLCCLWSRVESCCAVIWNQSSWMAIIPVLKRTQEWGSMHECALISAHPQLRRRGRLWPLTLPEDYCGDFVIGEFYSTLIRIMSPPPTHRVCVFIHKLPAVLEYFKLVNNHYGCAVNWEKRIINSPEPS